jgi:hypothetical protein
MDNLKPHSKTTRANMENRAFAPVPLGEFMCFSESTAHTIRDCTSTTRLANPCLHGSLLGDAPQINDPPYDRCGLLYLGIGCPELDPDRKALFSSAQTVRMGRRDGWSRPHRSRPEAASIGLRFGHMSEAHRKTAFTRRESFESLRCIRRYRSIPWSNRLDHEVLA